MTLGPVKFDNSLSTFTNNVDVSGRLNVEDNSSFQNNLTIGGNTTVDGNATVTGDLTSSVIINSGDIATLTLNVQTTAFTDDIVISDTVQLTPGALTEISSLDSDTVNILAIDPSSGVVQKIELGGGGSKTIPGTIVPFYGFMSTGGANKTSHATVEINIGTTYYPYNEDTSAADETWLLCNGGSSGGFTAPDLSDKFIIAGPTNTYPMSSTGGNAAETLTVDMLPEHRHNFNYVGANNQTRTIGTGASGTFAKGSSSNNKTEPEIYDSAGALVGPQVDVPIIPPYYALYHIIKLPSA